MLKYLKNQSSQQNQLLKKRLDPDTERFRSRAVDEVLRGESPTPISRTTGNGADGGVYIPPLPPASPAKGQKQGGESALGCWNCDEHPGKHKATLTTGKDVTLCTRCLEASVLVQKDEKLLIAYTPQIHQMPFHESNTPNLLAWGPRGTGKSKSMRWDAIARCLAFPGFKALILRRKMTDLRKSHLRFIGAEAKLIGARYRESATYNDVKFENGSFLQFGHCEDASALDDYLSSQWDYIGFDELSTFTLDQFLKISGAARVDVDKPYIALVRACSNPLGPGAAWMKAWFIDHVVDYSDFPDYNPLEFENQFSNFEDNRYIDQVAYKRRMLVLPEHVRRAWLDGEFVMEGAYFKDFRGRKDGREWHTIETMPTWKGIPIDKLPWVSIYRAVDWGYAPDPAVCLWIAVLPDRSAVVFKEVKWQRTLAADVAKEIKRLSKGMRVIDTFCDPTMFIKTGTSPYSIGEIFENNGVALTPSQNDRQLAGYAVHELLNTMVNDEPDTEWDGEADKNPYIRPRMQILEYACPNLVRTFPILTVDKSDPRKIGDGDDHYVLSLAYFAMGKAEPTQDPEGGSKSDRPRWMRPKTQPRSIGYINV